MHYMMHYNMTHYNYIQLILPQSVLKINIIIVLIMTFLTWELRPNGDVVGLFVGSSNDAPEK